MQARFRPPARLSLVLAAATACGPGITGIPDPITELPRQLTVAEGEVIDASNAFSFDLLHTVVGDAELGGGNVFLSPFSVSMALGMTLNGAAGETFESMRATLRFDNLDQTAINESYRDLTKLLLDLDDAVELTIANSLWARQGFPFHPTFFQTVEHYFDAHAAELDFSSPAAKDVINGWVNDKTHGRIEDIVEQINPLDVLFLINAIHFNGSWTNRFDEADTRLSDFHLEGGAGTVQVETMTGKVNVGTYTDWDRGIEVGELPYGGQAFSMVVAMPAPGGSVDDLVATLDQATWDGWMQRLHYDEAPVRFPKITMEYGVRLDTALKALGMGVAFDDSAADFSNMTDAQVFISRVRHKTFLRIDEEGTEAAAATSVGVTVTSAPMGLTVDRPFILAIRERLTGVILFMGVVRDPREP